MYKPGRSNPIGMGPAVGYAENSEYRIRNAIHKKREHFANHIGSLSLKTTDIRLFTLEDVHGILAARECTHFANCGAQYWQQKDADGRTDQAEELVFQVQRLAELFRPTDPDYWRDLDIPFFWTLENPVGRLPKLIDGLGEALYFDPCDYAGYPELSGADHSWNPT